MNFIGNSTAKNLLERLAQSISHVLLVGPSGHGKNTLVERAARNLVAVKATAIQDHNALYACFKRCSTNSTLFIDEIHSLKKDLQESLYDVLDTGQFNRITGRGSQKSYENIPLPKFSIFAATTKEHELLPPLKNRFIIVRLQTYSFPELVEMARSKIKAEPEVPMILAEHCRGVPRVLDTLCNMFIKFNFQNSNDAFELIKMLGIFPQGLTNTEVEILKILKNPQSLNSLAARMNLEEEVIKEEHEPFLIYKGLIERSKNGRELTRLGKEYLEKIEPKILRIF